MGHRGTSELLAASAGSVPGLRVIRFDTNRQGRRRQAGMLAAAAPLALMTDVDVATPLEEAARLLDALDRGFDVAISSRALPTSTIAIRQPSHRELMGRTFNRMLRISTGLPFRDTQCGFKLFRLERARRLFELRGSPASPTTRSCWCWPAGSRFPSRRSRCAGPTTRERPSGCFAHRRAWLAIS